MVSAAHTVIVLNSRTILMNWKDGKGSWSSRNFGYRPAILHAGNEENDESPRS
jgi:hypothetical protein